MSNKVLSIIMVVAMLALGIATVSADGHIIQLPDVDPVAVEGDIIAAGSSTVFPLEQAIAEQFEADGYAGNFTIDSIGSGGGFERFCEAGESDISNASRPIKDGEVENCNGIGREPIEFVVGIDALAVTVSSENDFVTDVTIEELAQIFGEAELWSDVRAEWPEEPIQRFIPGTDSGTFDYFVEAVFDDSDEIILAASNTQLSEDDNVLVQGVSGSPYAVGFFGFAYYSENAETLNVASVEGVDATAETAQSFEYPLSRPLFVYSDASIMAEKPQVASFINYFLTNVNDLITEVGYFPLSDEALNESKAALAEAAGYEVEGHSDDDMAEDMDDMMEVVELPAVDPVAVEGDIIAAGSSTVFPLEQAIAEQFEADGYAGNFTIDSIGSGGGFERFCEAGESDISNASRPIKDGEVENCNGIGRTHRVCRRYRRSRVTVSSENDFVTDVTIEELAQIFGEAELWSDVRAEWPEEPIQRFIPGTDSGTFDYFVEAVFDDSDEIILAASNTQLSEDDNVLVQGVSGSPYAVGFFGFAYYSENAETLNVASVEGVDATAETAQSFEYPLSRPLFVYSDASIMAEKSQVASFINYFLTNVNDLITEVGYFPLSDEALNESKAALAEAAGY